MRSVIVGIDTSCYTTSVALVDINGDIILNSQQLLPVPKGALGLRQREAVFAHTRLLTKTLDKLRLALNKADIQGVAASVSPTSEPDSYMPVFLVGKLAGEAISIGAKVPFISTDHQAGHIAAAKVDTEIKKGSSFLAIHLSGGTTDVLLCQQGNIKKVGGSKDINAGQLVDRLGTAMGLSFPSGKELELLALNGQKVETLPSSLAEKGLYCHFSGGETQLLRWVKSKAYVKEDIALETYDLLVRTVGKMIINHCNKWSLSQVLLAGGVASSNLFKRQLIFFLNKRAKGIKLFFARQELAGDNAVGVAMIGRKHILKTIHNTGGLDNVGKTY